MGVSVWDASPLYENLKDFAIGTGMSRKGYWHLAKTLSTNCGLGNEFLKEQGLTSIRTLWIGIRYLATAR
ncbi:MAG: hypothetical protein OHK006_18920 [Thermodesulfovibrionales bacterium]